MNGLADILMSYISAETSSFETTNNNTIIDSVSQILKTLSGKYLSGKVTPSAISCMKNQASINYPGIQDLSHQPHTTKLTLSDSMETLEQTF